MNQKDSDVIASQVWHGQVNPAVSIQIPGCQAVGEDTGSVLGTGLKGTVSITQ